LEMPSYRMSRPYQTCKSFVFLFNYYLDYQRMYVHFRLGVG
jgi:hypothetical protein